MNKKFIIVIGVVVVAYYYLFVKQSSNNQSNISLNNNGVRPNTIIPPNNNLITQSNLQQQIQAQYSASAKVYEAYNVQCRLLCIQTGGQYTPFQFDFNQGKWIGGYCSVTAGQVAIDTYLKQQVIDATRGRG